MQKSSGLIFEFSYIHYPITLCKQLGRKLLFNLFILSVGKIYTFYMRVSTVFHLLVILKKLLIYFFTMNFKFHSGIVNHSCVTTAKWFVLHFNGWDLNPVFHIVQEMSFSILLTLFHAPKPKTVSHCWELTLK